MIIYKYNDWIYGLLSFGESTDPLYQLHTPTPNEKEYAEKNGVEYETWKDYYLQTKDNPLIKIDADYVWINTAGDIMAALPDPKRSAVLICSALEG